MKVLKGIVFIINVFIVLITIFAYISPFVDPSKFWGFSFFGLIYPYLILLNFLFIIFWLYTDKKKLLLSLIILIIGYQNISKLITFNNSDVDTSKSISILSYNLNEGIYLYKNKIDKGKFVNYISEQDADIFLSQESNLRFISKRLKGMDDYKYKHVLKNIGTGIYSKFPIIQKGQIDFNLKTNSCLWVDIKVKDDTFRLYSVHFQSNQISKHANDLVEDLESDQKIKSKDIREILARYKRNVQIRSFQVKKVIKHLKQSPYPIIVGGDFNDPPTSYTYQQFAELLKDAFKEKGKGLGISYAGNIPLLRIDFIMVSDDFSIIDFQTLKEKYSDHFAIKTIIQN